MLAWLFWHARRRDVPEHQYQRALLTFHERLRSASPRGFLGSRTLRYEALPWLEAGGEVFEDWYLLRDAGSLDDLDDVVADVIARDAHSAVSGLALTAAAGLYRLRAGSPLAVPGRVSWLSKNRGDAYDTFVDELASAGSVWSRKMVLGPAPEFCLESDAPIPSALRSRTELSLTPQTILSSDIKS